jgi:hypothetical protein
MPYGKFRDRSVGELAETEDGRSYLRWLASEVHGNAAIAAGIVLGTRDENAGSDRRPVESEDASCSDSTSHQKRNPGLQAGTSSNARDLTNPSGGTDLLSEQGRSIHETR